MKKYYTLLVVFLLCNITEAFSQSSPQWIRDINALPDTAVTYPVRILNTSVGDVVVLSTYFKQSVPDNEYKIQLRKYDYTGTILWSYTFDNAGNNDVRAYDMALDNQDNIYLVGSIALTSMSGQPLLMKISATGNYMWHHIATVAFSLGSFDKIKIRNNKVYVASINGIAQFDFWGLEQWSHAYLVAAMDVDYNGQMIFSAYVSNPNTIFRVDVNGNINFSAVSIIAKRIAVDQNNGFYLFDDTNSNYELVKFDSAGAFLWNYNQFPAAPPFGDIGMEVLVDYNNDVIVAGVFDTIYKFSSSGIIKWIKPMNGLDNYRIAAQITGNNQIAVAGSVQGSGGYDMAFSFFDLFGNVNWSGLHNGGGLSQEFVVDMTVLGDGVYIIEDKDQNTLLAKFELPFSAPIDYSLVCVDSVWYDPNNPQLINVSIFNGNVWHMNYPSVQIVSPQNDTIGNPSNLVNFFAHLGNSFQTYSDTIAISGITDFSNYTFLMSEGFGDTSVAITWCNPTSLSEEQTPEFSLYPNPVNDKLYLNFFGLKNQYSWAIVNTVGQIVKEGKGFSSELIIPVMFLSEGVYIIRLQCYDRVSTIKFIKQN